MRETERAAGGDELLKVHDDLIQFRRQETRYLGENENWNSKLQNLEDRNRAVEREVTRFLERDAIMKKIEVLKLAIPWLKYDELVVAYQEAKAEKEIAKKDYEELHERGAPLEEKIKKATSDYKKYDQSVKTSAKEVADLMEVHLYL